MANTFRYGANFKIVGKTEPQKLSYAGAWSNVDGNFKDLADHIGRGHPWMPALLNGNKQRCQSNANYAEVIALDHDNTGTVNGEKAYSPTLTIEQALVHPFISAHAGLIIESASGSPDWHKFRTVYRLPRPVDGWQIIRVCNRYLAHVVGDADPACKDASRFFFGAPGRDALLLNESATLPDSFIEDAIAWDKAKAAKAEAEAEEKRKRFAEYRAANPVDSGNLVRDALAHIPPYSPGEGRYSQLIAMIGGVLSEMGFEGEALLRDWDGGRGQWGRGGFNRILKSVANAHTGSRATLGTLFYLAKESGFRFPETKTSYKAALEARYKPSQPQYSEEEKAAYKAQKQAERKAAYLAKVEEAQTYLSRLDEKPTYQQETKYIPSGIAKLPEKSGIIIIDAEMGQGKTSVFLKELVSQHHQLYVEALAAYFSPRNNLNRQAGKILRLPFHKLVPNFSIKTQPRFSGCMESFEKFRIEDMPIHAAIQNVLGSWEGKAARPLIILDEFSQILDQLLTGQTLKNKQAECLMWLIALLNYIRENQGWIVVSEDGVSNIEIEFLKSVSGLEIADFYKFTKPQSEENKREYEIYEKKSGASERILTELKNPETNLILATDSRKYAQEIAEMAKRKGIEGIWLLDSDTSEEEWAKAFCENPDQWVKLNQPRLLIYSPSLQSGASLKDEDGHFSALAFYLAKLTPHTSKQLVERLRSDVPRFGFIKEQAIQADDDFRGFLPENYVIDTINSLEDNHRLLDYAEWCRKNEPIKDKDGNTLDLSATFAQLLKETQDRSTNLGKLTYTLAQIRAKSNWGKFHLRDFLANLWKSRGHDVPAYVDTSSSALSKQHEAAREDLDKAEAENFASIAVDTNMTVEDAHRLLSSPDASKSDRDKALKCIRLDQLPGIDLNNPDFVLKVFIKESGQFFRGAHARFKALNSEKIKQSDRYRLDSLLTKAALDGAVFLPSVRIDAMGAQILAEAPLDAFLAGSVPVWGESTPEAVEFHQWAWEQRYLIQRHLRLSIHHPDKGNSHLVVNKFLRKQGFEVKGRLVGPKGSQTRIYYSTNLNDPDRELLIEAMGRRLDEKLSAKLVNSFCNEVNNNIPSANPVDQAEALQVPDVYRYSDWNCPCKVVSELSDGTLLIEAIDPTRRTITAEWDELRPWNPADTPKPLEVPVSAHRGYRVELPEGYEPF